MKNVVGTLAACALLAAVGTAPAFAERRTIEQLPEDIEKVSEVAVEIPSQMSEVTQESGPVVGVTKGAIVGAGNVANTVGEALLVEEDEEGKAPLIRYAF